jgi:hypothetical protein
LKFPVIFRESKGIKKSQKILLVVLAVITLMPAISYTVLRSSRVQTYLAQRVAAHLSQELQTQVSVGGVDISFFLNVVLEDVGVQDRKQESMIFTRRMVFDIDRVSLRHRKLSINRLYLEQAFLGLTRYPGEEEFNFQFLVDYFARDDADTLPGRRWDVVCRSFEFKNSGFTLRDTQREEKPHGFDPGHFAIAGFQMLMNDISLDRDTLSFELDHLTFEEASGFQVDYLSGSIRIAPDQAFVHNLLLRSPLSDISMNVLLEYEGYHAFSDFAHEVDIDLLINESHTDLADLGMFIPGIYGMEGRLDIFGNISGQVSNIRGNNLLVLGGRSTVFKGGFHLNGLPDIEETFINFYVNEFRTNAGDILSLKMPKGSSTPHPNIPENISTLGRLFFEGRLTGFINDFSAFGQLTTDIGKAKSDIRIIRNGKNDDISYRGNLETTNFDLGSFFNRENVLGKVSFNAHVEGSGITLETIETALSGTIGHINLVSYDYKNLEVSGAFSNSMFVGSLLVDDENLSMDFNGEVNLEGEIPLFDFTAKVDHANLSRLNIYQRDTLMESAVSGLLSMRARGTTMDEVIGSLRASDLNYYEISVEDSTRTQWFTDNVLIENEDIDGVHKHLRLRSGFLEADLHGQILFHRMGMAARQFASTFLPALFEPEPLENGNQFHQDFIFEIRIKDVGTLTELFLPIMEIAPYSTFNGAFDSRNKALFFNGYSDQLSLQGNRFTEWEMSGQQENGRYKLAMESNRLMFSDSLFIERFQWNTQFFNDSVWYEAHWNNRDTTHKNEGHIQGLARFYERNYARMQILPSYAFVNDSLWQVNTDNEIWYDTTGIEIHNLLVYKNKESFKAEGILRSDPEAYMHLTFNNFNVSNFDFFFRHKNLEFAGIINGGVSIAGLGPAPNVQAELLVKDFGFNRDHLGDLKVDSRWDQERKGFQVDASIIYYGNIGYNTPLVASGYFYPDRRDENFDLDIRIENLRMSIFSRYLEGFAQNFRGMASGNLRLEGPASAPELSGIARLVRTGFRVEYLNTSYSFAHELEVGKDYFRVTNLLLNDTLGNSALVNGSVFHQNFRDFSLDIRLQPERMAILNTTFAQNDLYYGRAILSGLAHIHGPADNITMDISARTNRGTQIFLPLDYTGEVVENNFITFITRDTTVVLAPMAPPDLAGITLNFDLEVTPEAEVQLIFDSQIGDIIRGRGTGNLKFEITSLGAFNMYGDYVIEEGDYLFTLQNLINKRFRVEQGGSIRWTGDPYDADIDLRAAYRLRTALYDLVMDVDTSDVYRRRVPVETIMILEGKLFNPSISFDINLPGGDESTREMVERLITTEQEMNRQVFSLLVLNRFMPTSIDQYNTALGYGVGSTSTELLSNQLSNWLSQISSDFDIGINYRPGDEISSQELEVALSTQFFDDRVTIDGNVGVAGNHPANTQRASTIIGDVVVEVKITPEGKFRVKAFNRSNTFDVMNTNSPYTQGVGVFYRKEFDSLYDLLRRSRRPPPEETGYLED